MYAFHSSTTRTTVSGRRVYTNPPGDRGSSTVPPPAGHGTLLSEMPPGNTDAGVLTACSSRWESLRLSLCPLRNVYRFAHRESGCGRTDLSRITISRITGSSMPLGSWLRSYHYDNKAILDVCQHRLVHLSSLLVQRRERFALSFRTL